MALHRMAAHGLHGWVFRFNRCKQAMGLYSYHRKTIELSISFVERDNPVEEIRDTILHEIAHALVGPGHGHDKVWKRKCIEIGARPLRYRLADMPEGKWRARCWGCGCQFHRYRRPKRARGWFCRRCGPEVGRLVWKSQESPELRRAGSGVEVSRHISSRVPSVLDPEMARQVLSPPHIG